MLNKDLIAKTAPVALPENTVFFLDYRITVLGDRLFRIEKNASHVFNDDATQCVWYRNAPPQHFTVHTDTDGVCITTAEVCLSVDCDFKKSFVELDGSKIAINNDGNLLGTTRTLDCYDGTVYIRDASSLTLGTGVCSKSGVAVIDDTNTLRLLQNGQPARASDDELDIYVFAFGKDYRGAVRALYSITGSAPMLPRYALGNWWSRYHAYTDEEYLHLLNEFEKSNIPFTVATLDIDWHYSADVDEEKQISASGKATEDRGCAPENAKRLGWTGYSWNPKYFPDYKAFLSELKRRNYKVTLNLHPADGVRYYEDMYPEMARAMGIDPKSEKVVKFDIADTRFVNNYFEILHHPYEKDGVDFWWIDWQQGTQSELQGLDPLWALNHYHYLDNGTRNKQPLIMSRYAGVGSHRYPVGFSGDTTISWQTLELLPYFTATATNIGYTWWCHDIGGHHLGIKDDELYLRFLQFGVFNPINHLHCTDSSLLTKEPWAYENGIGELAEKMFVLRHRMIPFLYTCNRVNAVEGRALIEPLYYDYPDAPEAYQFKNEYIFGKDFIVAPITKHSQSKGLTAIDMWVPEGVWTDIFTGDIYRIGRGGKVICAVRPLDSIPVLARAGAVMVLSNDTGNSTDNPHHLEAHIYNGNGEFELYEDDGDLSCITRFETTAAEGEQKVRISFKGNTKTIPSDRKLTLIFKNIHGHAPDTVQDTTRETVKVSATANGESIKVIADTFAIASITIETLDTAKVYEVTVRYKQVDMLTEVRRGVFAKLQRTQGYFSIKNMLAGSIERSVSCESLRNKILRYDLEEIDKKRLIEAIPDCK